MAAGETSSDPKPNANRHCVAVIGGATAGAEVAGRLAQEGVIVVVFEQNPRPYGKIEDGLPRWHHGLRAKEYASIDEKLSRDGVYFVPNTRAGRDVDFAELARDWGFSAVVLANGAWRDRPLPIEGADAYIDKGLVYQNPFVIAFNHGEQADFEGQKFEIQDGALIVGGGLASIDVAKIHTLELTRRKLADRGIDVSVIDLEVKGIPKILAAHDLSWEDLGLEGATIFYRRRIEDMPVMAMPDDADEKRREKVEAGRQRMVAKATEKYCFEIVPLSAPDSLIVEDDRVVGLVLRRTKIESGRVVMTDETFEARGPVVISSIGSIPEPIEGIPMKGELFDFQDWDLGRLADYPSVFSVGNVVTGKGNIVASRKHASHVTEDAIEAYLGIADPDEGGARKQPGSAMAGGTEDVVGDVSQHLANQKPLDPDALRKLLDRVEARQREVGYTDYKSWIESVGPPC